MQALILLEQSFPIDPSYADAGQTDTLACILPPLEQSHHSWRDFIMRPIIFALLALALLPSFLTGCGTNLPDTVVVTQYRLAPGTVTSPVPYDPITQNPEEVASPQYMLQSWKNTNSLLVQELYDDIQTTISYNQTHTTYFRPPTGIVGCHPFWYTISLQLGSQGILSIRLNYCPYDFIIHNDIYTQIPANADFLSVLTQQMHIPIQWR
jgi:hypothetical protein